MQSCGNCGSGEPARKPGFVDVEPLVSVVVPFLNCAEFLQEAIDSVFSQTYRNWELLLVDDGSTDASSAIARRCCEAHPERVQYLEHPGHANRGTAPSRNLGLRCAKGDLIAPLDADDVWFPRKLKQQVKLLGENSQAGMVFGAAEYWCSWSKQPAAKDGIPELGIAPNTLYHPPDLLYSLYPLGENTAPCPSDLLIRRTVFEKTGGFQEGFCGAYRVYEDQAFLIRVYLSEAVFVSGECWTRYRIHPGSCIAETERRGEYSTARLFFLRDTDNYLASRNVKDARVRGLLWKAFRRLGHSRPVAGIESLDARQLKWFLRVANGNDARLEFPSGDRELLRVAIAKSATKEPWDVQLNQHDLPVLADQGYRVCFRARAAGVRVVNVGFSKAHDPWDGLGLYRAFTATTEWQSFSFEFVAPCDDQNGRIHFDLGGDAHTVELASVIVLSLDDGRPLEPEFMTLTHDSPGDRKEGLAVGSEMSANNAI